ncbi:MAG TPA: HD domain-containing protein [Trueperaceae bacterium]|nr:HD domain-containing protein [Trueperaceae bacterium]
MLRTRRPARLREPDPTAFAPWPAAGVLVGGAVRDALLGREPSDLDWLVPDPRAACEAAARELGGSCFPLDETRGHWRAVAPGGGVTHDFAPLRGEVEDDLTRRDLTVNALALAASGGVLDPTGGLDDLREGRVRMTSEAALRADPVRPLRAVRFVAGLGFTLEEATEAAVRRAAADIAAGRLPSPAPERVRDELAALLQGADPAGALALAGELGLLATFLPELTACRGVDQGPLHHLDVFDHSLEALRVLVATFPDASLAERLATLLHDVGKPVTAERGPYGRPTFHGHDAAGAELTRTALSRLRFDGATVRRAAQLVRRHMLPLPTTDKGARRFAHRYRELLPDLLRVMLADREAARGRAASAPGRVRYRVAMSRVLAALGEQPPAPPLLTGEDVMAVLGIPPGPRVGEALRLVAEARAVGDVADAEDAVRLIRRYAAAQGWVVQGDAEA